MFIMYNVAQQVAVWKDNANLEVGPTTMVRLNSLGHFGIRTGRKVGDSWEQLAELTLK